MPYNRQIPDAPIALSMLPRASAADLKKNDLLYLVKPGNVVPTRLVMEANTKDMSTDSVEKRSSIMKAMT